MRIDDKKAFSEWQEYHKDLKKDIKTEKLSSAERVKKLAELEAKPLEWIKYFFGRFAKYEFTPFHKKAIRRLTENMEYYDVLSWSRELAKSTIVMFIVIYLVLTGKKRNILVVSNTKDNAIRLLDPYKKFFEKNSLVKLFYGDMRSYGNWAEDEFHLTNGASFRALGAGESPRGTRKDEVRPDIIVVDDFDTDTDCRNPDIVKNKWQWVEEALMPTRSVSEPLLFIWCGNIIAKNCCTKKAGEKADNWDIINIVDKNGDSTWAEKNTPEHIARIRSKISTKAFMQEYMNTPLVEGEVFKEMRWGKCPPLNKLQFAVVYGDPAPSNSKNKASSFKACFMIGCYQGTFYVYNGYLDHVVNDEYADWFYNLRDYSKNKTLLYYFVENNKLQDPFYQQVLRPLFIRKGAERGHISIAPDTRTKPDKYERIEANLEPMNREGRLILNEEEKGNPHMQRLEEQFLHINRAMKSPADGADCIEGGVWKINEIINAITAESITIVDKARNSKRY